MDGTSYEMDYEARRALNAWQRLKERGKQLTAEPRSLRAFQPEPVAPAQVGLGELLTDEFDPEELIELTMERDPLMVDWDADELVCV